MTNEWIKCSERLPRYGQVVDLWADGKRHADYERVKGGNWPKGSFQPTKCGIAVISPEPDDSYTYATHWMNLPPKPKL